ncbi:MAG: GNAT family N-acetyltransferase [Candidatus Solibacter usitatus]|nr:GNAT family N-acetyltransferase [Candidatus Solibacter usitatus]
MTQAHKVADFECSNASLDTWLKRFAWTNQRAETARTYVAHRNDRVVGYHSLVAGSVLKHEAPERVAQGIANHPVGVILLARLAVDKKEQEKGLGKALLRDALARISQAADVVGVRAVLVHAINDSAREFYLHNGFQPSPVDPMELMMLMKDLRASL